MGDKRDLTISNEKKQKQSSIMEKKDAKIKEKYISPQMQVHVFTLEKGFATSLKGVTDGDVSGQSPSSVEQWGTDQWDGASF